MKRNVRASWVVGSALLATAPLAGAQAATGSGQAAAPTEGAATLQEVTVTGSRVITNNSNSPTPIMAISTDQLQLAQPGPIAQSINLLPVFSGSRGPTSNSGISATAVEGGNAGADVLNLRNLGAERTLVLFNGQRIPPTLFNSAVDVDMIPQEFVKRVDVVTGGVSAVYGSDAISGVVNFVTDNDFNGVKAHAQYGISTYGDDKSPDIGLAAGTELFGGRGHVEGSYEYRDDQGIPSDADRPWEHLWHIVGNGTAAHPYHLASDTHSSNSTFGGLITSGALAGQTFASNGVLSPFQAGEPTGSSLWQIGGDGSYAYPAMMAGLRSHQIYGRLDYRFTDHLRGHVVAAVNLKTNTEYGNYAGLNNVTISADDAFLPAAYQQALAAAGESTFTLSHTFTYGPQLEGRVKTGQYYLNTGLEGDIGAYHWALSYNHGVTRLDTTSVGDTNNQRLAAALDAVVDPSTGNTVCAAALSDPADYQSCVPLNPFGPTAASRAALSYILGNPSFVAYTHMDDVNGDITGSPFSTWAGPVVVALSADWRSTRFSMDSDALADDYADCSALSYNCTQGTTTLWQATYPEGGTVRQSVAEGALEFDAPLVENAPLVKSLSLNGAVRYTSYSTSGNYVPWKLGVIWRLTDGLRFRAADSSDIRAPTLYDLYQPVSVIPGRFADLLTGTDPFVPSINLGNPQLKAEIGRTATAGFLWQPQSLRGTSISIDGYHTTISDAIVTVQGFNGAYQRVCYASGGASPYCALQARPNGLSDTSAANAVTAWYIKPENIAKIETYGADLQATFTHELWTRPFAARLLLSYQPHIVYSQPGTPNIDQGDAAWGQNGLTAAPSVQLTAFFAYEVTSDLTADLVEHWRNGMRESGVPTQVWIDNHVPSFATTAVTLSYDLQKALGIGDSRLFLTVDNLFNAYPPPTAYYNGNTGGTFADNPVGRYFTVGFRFRD